MANDTRSDTELVFASRGPDPQAFNTLFERWFPKAWNVARNILRDDDLAADIAQEAVLTAWERLDELENVDSFGGWLLRIARNRALNKLDRERRSLSADDETVSGLRDSGGFDPTAADRLRQPDQVSDAHDQQELVWAASVALGPNDASLLDLHLRHGLSATEIADELGVSANTAHQQLFRLKGKLGKAVGSYLLWRHGRPLCENLAKAVSGSVAFDQSVSQAVTRHEKTCSSCAGDRKALVSPAKLFSSAPLVVMPLHLHAKAAAALAEAGVPVQLAPISTESGPSETDQSDSNQSDTGQSDTDHSDTGRYSEPNPATEHTIANRPFLEQTHRRSSEFQETTSLPSPSRWNSRVLVGASGGAVCLALIGGILYLAFGFGVDESVIETNVAVEASQEEADLEPDADNSQGSAARNGDSAASTLDPRELLTAPQPPVPAGPQIARPTTNPDDTSGDSTTTPASPNPASTVSSPTSGSSSTVLPPTPTSGPSSGRPTSNPTTSNPSTSNPSTGSSQTSRPTTPTSTVSSPVTPTSTGTSTSGTASTPTSSNTTVPVSPSTPTRPTTSSPSSSSVPGPSTSSPTPTPTSPDVDPPEIQRFLATQATDPGDCGRRQAYLARWSALNTDSVTLTTPSGSFNGGASGQQSFCGAAGDTIGLVAVGPGGETRGSAQL